jgi:hypothetical protein
MTFTNNTDTSRLVQLYHAQLYRLALLMSGDARAAAQAVERSYSSISQTNEAEAALIRGLWSSRVRQSSRWRVGQEEASRAAIDLASAQAIADTVMKRDRASRLIIGLSYVRGMSPHEITTLFDNTNLPNPEAVLAQFRRDVAHALDVLPPDADPATIRVLDQWLDGQLDSAEALEARRAVLEEAEAREVRDGLLRVRELLPRAVPALFSATPPTDLTDRLFEIAASGPKRPTVHLTRARLALTLGVLALVLAIIFVPGWLPRGGQSRAPAPQTAVEIIDSAIRRFERPPLQSGVLHERYQIDAGDEPAYVIERWYDYAAPHRLAVEVRVEGREGPPLTAISSDGRGLIQYRYAEDSGRSGQPAIDVRVSAAEAEAMLPLLRGMFAPTMFSWPMDGRVDIGPLYLGQARAANAAFLGQTQFLGRDAYLLSYQTDVLPTASRQAPEQERQRQQVLLTIDAQTYALLEVSTLPAGAAEGMANQLLQMQQIEISADIPAERLQLPADADVVQRNGTLSVNIPAIPTDEFLTLEDARQQAARPLLVPQQLPDKTMRGLAVLNSQRDGSQSPILLYEGEFQTAVLLPRGAFGDTSDAQGEEQAAGAFRYRIVQSPLGEQRSRFSIAAEIYRPEAPDERLIALLVDAYATDDEREAKLRQMIESLTPVTPENVSALQERFHPLPAAGG